ncbi:MAG: hypothetical protein ACUVRD_08705 [Bacteroidia bacterium]
MRGYYIHPAESYLGASVDDNQIYQQRPFEALRGRMGSVGYGG